MSLRLTDIGYTYGAGTTFAVTALSDVSLEVGRGEFVLVLGATGSGKSTLLRVAAGLLEPERGLATIDGRPLGRETARGAIGLVFQDAESQLFAETVLADVAFGPRNLGLPHDQALEAAREALDAVGLEPDRFADRSPFSLSGGEARRAAIAGVLAMKPGYLLADEPTAGLDAAGRRAMRRLLLRVREEAGIVVVSHTAGEYLGMADRVIVLGDGRVLLSATAETLVARPELFAEAGLRAPDVLEVQRLVHAARSGLEAPVLDPHEAARRLCGSGVVSP